MRMMKKFYLGLVFAGLAMPSIVSADITTNLQEYWTMDGNASASVNPSVHDGTYVTNDGLAADYVSGKFGSAIDLERGDGEYLDIDNSVTAFDHVGGSITVSMWVDFEDNQTSWQALIGNGEGGAWRMAGARADREGLGVAWAASGDDIYSDSESDPATADIFDAVDTGFHHVVGVFDGTGFGVSSFYVDGVLTATIEGTEEAPIALTDNFSGTMAADPDADPPVTALGITIGNNSDRRDRNFDGIIDDVAIWDTALTEAEILSIWNNGDGASIASLTGGSTAPALGDFDGNGIVDCADLDGYVGNIGEAADGPLVALDFDGSGTLEASDANTVITTLVTTGNGVVGTFSADLNCDGTVNVLGDAFILVGSLGNPATTYAEGDINFDGTVNVLGDAFILVGQLGSSNAP